MLTLEDEQFLKGAGIIRKRALLTTAAVAAVSVVLVVFFAGLVFGTLRSSVAAGVAASELNGQILRLTAMLRASILLFLATVFVTVVGIAVLILAYERQASHLVHMVRRVARLTAGSGGG